MTHGCRLGLIGLCLAALLGGCAQRAPRPEPAATAPTLSESQARQLVHGWQQQLGSYLAQAGDGDPAALRLHLSEAVALIASPHPVVSIWQAHRSDAPDRFAPVREALARGHGERALVHREGFAVRVLAVPEATAGFMQALRAGASLGHALDAAGPRFAFDGWLVQALQQGWLRSVEPQDAAP